MNPSHLAKGVGPDLYWASSFELHHFNEGQPDRGGRAIDDVYSGYTLRFSDGPYE